ncbi:MAG TPA: tetratricopeptide repeat protein [Pirellulales bacterium]|jgi:tetratricopeptide (TPR) repeat protein|nr:tetratricopeptide repeat protein [Pirellulales bacterium]
MPRSKNNPQLATTAPPRSDIYYAWGVCGFLLLAVGLIYGQTLWHILLAFDDNIVVSANPHVLPGLTGDGVRWAFTEGPYGEWYPLTMLSHMLDCQIFGPAAWGHHLTNLLIHAATAIGLFLVLWRMTAELWPSAFVTAIFAVHPQHVESVAWLAERKDVLSGLFFVLTLGAWLGYVRHGRSLARYLLMALLFALGLMSKPMLVTLPPLLLLLDFWPLARIGAAIDTPRGMASLERPGIWRLVLEKLPLAALAIGDGLVTLRTHASGGVLLPASGRIGNALVACVDYVAQFCYPVDLAAFYPIPPGGPPQWKVGGAAAILAIVSAAAVVFRRRCPYCFVGWFWYLGMLFPVLGVVKIGWLAMADRYMYLPGIGLSIALAWGTARLAAGSLTGRRVLAVTAGVAIALLTAGAAWQTSVWRNDQTLWTHALACTNDNGKAELGLADVLARQGRLETAIPHYRRAVQFATDARPFCELGLVLVRQGQLDEATALFRQAVEIDPDGIDALCSLGLALAEQNQFDESKRQFLHALEIDPRAFKAHRGLAHVLRLEGKTDESLAELERAVQLDPGNTAARNELGVVLLQQAKIDPSILEFQATLAIDPRYLPAQVNLGLALTAAGRIDEAEAHFRQALVIDPHNPVARKNLDRLLREQGSQPAP